MIRKRIDLNQPAKMTISPDLIAQQGFERELEAPDFKNWNSFRQFALASNPHKLG
jgi:hypothetical protein